MRYVTTVVSTGEPGKHRASQRPSGGFRFRRGCLRAWDFPVLHTLCGIRASRIARFGARGLIDGEIELDGNLVSRLMLSSGDVERIYGYILRDGGTCMYKVRSLVVMMYNGKGLFVYNATPGYEQCT